MNTALAQEAQTDQAPSLKGHSKKELKKVCADFEAMFIKQILELMRKSTLKSGLLDGGLGKDIYTDLFDQQLSKVLAQGRGIGIGAQLYKNLVQRYGEIKHG